MTHQLFWGDLHSHCAISYGHGTVEQALLRAAQQLDFCSVTGHAFWPDMPTDRDRYADIIDYHTQGFATLAGNWERLLELQSAATSDRKFIAFPSYEWHSLQFGDHNVYSAGPQLPLRDAHDLPALRRLAAEHKALMIPHHIGYRSGFRGINWEAYREDVSPFVEVFSLHGCSVADDSPYPMLHDMGPRDFGSTAEAGWQHGFRFGIVGGTDHHAAWPGSHSDGRMGVFARELTRESLWEAFLARRVFAATGDRIDARLFLDDAWIGETVTSNGSRHLRVLVDASDAIDRAELWKNGRILHRFYPQTEAALQGSGLYRLRITWGWGRTTEPADWQLRLELSSGTIQQVETCFSGQAIVAPQAASRAADGGTVQTDVGTVRTDVDLPHAVLERSDRACQWRSITQGNKTMRHESTQAISFEIDAALDDSLVLEANGQQFRYRLNDLLRRSHSHYLRGWLSEAVRIGPLVPISDCRIHADVLDYPEAETDLYRLQVAQNNGQWAWLTPIWAERHTGG